MAAFFQSSLLRFLHQPLKVILGVSMEKELAGIGPSFIYHCHCFGPDQAGTARGKALVAAEGVFRWTSCPSPVRTFHGMDCQGIRRNFIPHFHPIRQRGQVIADGNIHLEFPDLGAEIIQILH